MISIFATLKYILAAPLMAFFRTFSSNPGGSVIKFNMTAIGQIKNTPGTLRRLFVQVAGTTTNLVLNDTNSTGTPAIGNQILTIPPASLVAGAIIIIDAVCANGITVSGTWPTGLVLVAAYD